VAPVAGRVRERASHLDACSSQILLRNHRSGARAHSDAILEFAQQVRLRPRCGALAAVPIKHGEEVGEARSAARVGKRRGLVHILHVRPPPLDRSHTPVHAVH